MLKMSVKNKIIIALVLGMSALLGAFLFGNSPKTSTVMIENGKNQEDANQKEEKVVSDNETNLEPEDSKGSPEISQEKSDTGSAYSQDNRNVPQKEKTPVKSDVKITKRLINFGFEPRNGRKIDTIIIHSSHDALGQNPFSIEGIIGEYRQYGVSAHYLIGRDGTIYQLVDDKNVAYHAGASKVPDGRSGVNEFSIGIEMVNTKDGKFTDKQYESLNGLLSILKSEYKIKYVLGHDQIAPGRKDDPWNFDWDKIK